MTTVREIRTKGYEVKILERSIPATMFTHSEPFCLLWNSGSVAASDELNGCHQFIFGGMKLGEDEEMLFDILHDNEATEKGSEVPARRVWNGRWFIEAVASAEVKPHETTDTPSEEVPSAETSA
ncbi:hypothetical protein [Microvirga brassicacearum]|uniref:Uncharacterized protein n=1 Tax=Microvirga brassicacearum TaxID=2580413 RepID=A0A5N3P741_9HYPH|nr:hypothetical protein [Microvirga brassicacearum]KAB0265544.1 hypothetical protein FEZ63_17890 [Microvirga brassicacearum]